MPSPKDILGQIAAGRVLDVATGGGGFVHFLLEGLSGCTEIIGVDNNDRAEGHPDLQTRGAELRQRVEEVGFHSATALVVMGRK